MFNVFSDQPALIDGDNGRIITHRDLHEASKAFPFKNWSLIFLFNRNRVEDVVTYVSAMNAGNVVCLLDGNMHDSFKQHLVDRYSPDYVFSDQAIEVDYKAFAPGIYKSKKAGPHLHEKLQLLLSTSGTTGNPKLIRLSKQNLVEKHVVILILKSNRP